MLPKKQGDGTRWGYKCSLHMILDMHQDDKRSITFPKVSSFPGLAWSFERFQHEALPLLKWQYLLSEVH